MRTCICILVALALVPLAASAQVPASDRVAFGADVLVRPGEVVRDAISFGGDTVVHGEVLGSAVSLGGSVVLEEGGHVRGEVVSVGGRTAPARRVATAASAPATAIDRALSWLRDAARNAMAHVLLFVLGLLLIGVARERLGAMQVTMIRDGVKTAGVGLLAYVASVVAIVLFAITLVGIPVAVVVALALPVATYVGLAAAATVLGALLPLPRLSGREVPQLAAGVGVLFAASLVPGVGAIATAIAACLGFGALVRTRFSALPPRDLPTNGAL